MMSTPYLGTELDRVNRLSDQLSSIGSVQVLSQIEFQNKKFPIIALCLGSNESTAPTFGLFSGVHGLEKIGSHLSLYYLESIISQWSWNRELRERFERCRLVSIPIINPTGMYRSTRSNFQNVDLMRNSPVEAEEKPIFLIGGHRISPCLPWYRGPKKSSMELESQTLIEFVKKEMFDSKFSFALDLHSGFGMVDRLWYPYAKSKKDFPRIAEAKKFASLLHSANPYHVYQIEAQSHSYVTHGDLWDYIYDLHESSATKKNIFIPWALEMGSWIWLRKNPKQAFSILGHFNPMKPHRYRRILRRHYFLLDFFFKSIANADLWL
ncbi:MAG: hypothetical protein A4S09_14255 [Proteobacteria bacterium SG_bin7]|nr:MAG: hypothetical protein A4S09_14255 [Proteobacteria bacterium SG_bin7]